jgi:hypothetical protein
MSRFLFVVQESTSRSFPLPPPLNDELQKELVLSMRKIRNRKGVFRFSSLAEAWYLRWYRERHEMHVEKQFAGYYERKPDHIIRLAMIMKIAEIAEIADAELVLEVEHLDRADRILSWLEERLPSTFDEMVSSTSGEDQARIIRILRNAGGSMEHSLMLRRNSSKMNAEQFKRSMATLREAKMVEWDAATHTYYLTSVGWD